MGERPAWMRKLGGRVRMRGCAADGGDPGGESWGPRTSAMGGEAWAARPHSLRPSLADGGSVTSSRTGGGSAGGRGPALGGGCFGGLGSAARKGGMTLGALTAFGSVMIG